MTDFESQCDILIDEMLARSGQLTPVPLVPTLNSREELFAIRTIADFLETNERQVAYASSICTNTVHHLYRYHTGELFTVYSTNGVPYAVLTGSRYI